MYIELVCFFVLFYLHNWKIEVFPVNTTAGAEVPSPNARTPIKDAAGKTVYSAINREVLENKIIATKKGAAKNLPDIKSPPTERI
mgnify:CR=1 FL=1